MPDRDRVAAFIDEVVNGDHVRAIEEYYHPAASMRENSKEPRRGRDILIAHESAFLACMSVRTTPVTTYLIDSDMVVIHWTFEMTDKDGVTRRLEELALQRWDGDRIIEERFFYDPASAETPLPGSRA